jgi:hypothetical protein
MSRISKVSVLTPNHATFSVPELQLCRLYCTAVGIDAKRDKRREVMR